MASRAAVVSAGDTPDVAQLLHEVGIGIALLFERTEDLVDEQDVELVSRLRTQSGPAGLCLALDDRARPVQGIEEVFRPLGVLVARPSKLAIALGNRPPLVEQGGEALERLWRERLLGEPLQNGQRLLRVGNPSASAV